MTLTIFSPNTSPSEPPKTVKSCANTQTCRPSTVPYPVTTPSPYGRFASRPKFVDRWRANSSISMKLPSSRRALIRSRAVILPRACCFSIARADPACTASSLRRYRSASLPAVVWMSISGVSSGIRRRHRRHLPRIGEEPTRTRGRTRDRPVPAVRGSPVHGTPTAPPDRRCGRCATRCDGGRSTSTSTRRRPPARRTPTWPTLARAGAPEGTVRTTDHQLAGRGRLARSWTSPPGAGIAVSVLLRPTAVPRERVDVAAAARRSGRVARTVARAGVEADAQVAERRAGGRPQDRRHPGRGGRRRRAGRGGGRHRAERDEPAGRAAAGRRPRSRSPERPSSTGSHCSPTCSTTWRTRTSSGASRRASRVAYGTRTSTDAPRSARRSGSTCPVARSCREPR